MTTQTDKSIRITMDKKAVIVEVLEGNTTKDRDRINPDMKSKRRALAKVAGVEDETLLAWIDETKRLALTGNYTPQTFTPPKPEYTAGDVILRGMDQPDAEGQTLPLELPQILTETLPTVAVETLMKWSDAKALCCLDVDYHGRVAPHESWLRSRVTADLAPRPFAWHFSRNGGLHLFYIASDPFTAEELAASAAMAWLRIDPLSAVELKTGVRGPGDRQVYFSPGGEQDTTALLRGWVDKTEADDQAAQEWRDAEGLEIGKRYDHTKCPINPTPGYKSTGDPVVVMENGVYCHRCQGEGRRLGCRRLGFAPYKAITGGDTAGELGAMIKNICHWGHARYILTRKYGMQETLAKKAYSAVLKTYHYNTKKAMLIPKAFDDSVDDLSRVGEDWFHLAQFKGYDKEGMGAILAKLPVVHEFNADDKPVVDAARVALLQQTFDFGDRGIPNINIVHGYSMSRQHLFDGNEETMYEVLHPALHKHGGRYLPTYIPGSKRNVEEAWGVIEELAPGIDRQLITLVMAAIGTAQETRLGMHPKLFVEGAAGAAKTTTPQLAAAILGAAVQGFSYRADENRWGHQMHQATTNGGLVMMDEIIKQAERAAHGRPITVREPFDPLLNLTPENNVNVMYKGARKYGRLPAIIMTEPSLPLEIRDERQIARRIWHWRVRGLKTWDTTFPAAGLGSEVWKLRLLSTKMAQACNAIMSDVIDRFFATPMSWEQIADAHGCKSILNSDAFDDLTPFLRDFFRLVCLEPPLTGELARRYPNGYKKITRDYSKDPKPNELENNNTSPLVGTYSMFADGRGRDWVKSRRLMEKEWSDILKVDDKVNLDMKTDGSSVFVRFSVGRISQPVKVNEQIIDPTNWEAR